MEDTSSNQAGSGVIGAGPDDAGAEVDSGRSAHQPWMSQLKLALGLGLVAVACAGGVFWTSGDGLPYASWSEDVLHVNVIASLAIAAACSGLCCLVLLQQVLKRAYGQRVERSAVKRLEGLLPLGYSLRASVPVPGLGDADVIIEHDDGDQVAASFVIEIKSQQIVEVRRRLFGHGVDIRGAGGKPMERDPLRQLTALAQATAKSPVLWFPVARSRKIVKLKREGVVIVLGDAKSLLRAIGLRRGLLW